MPHEFVSARKLFTARLAQSPGTSGESCSAAKSKIAYVSDTYFVAEGEELGSNILHLKTAIAFVSTQPYRRARGRLASASMTYSECPRSVGAVPRPAFFTLGCWRSQREHTLILLTARSLPDRIFGNDRIRDRPISPRSPWQNPYAERLIGSLRRECLDHVLIVGERHLRRILALYSSYYNESRTHLALEKDAPLQRAIQRCGAIIRTPVLSGLHHRYARIRFSGTTAGLLKPSRRSLVVSGAIASETETFFYRRSFG